MSARASEGVTRGQRPQGFDQPAAGDRSTALAVTTQLLGLLLLVGGGVLSYLLIAIWPAVSEATVQQDGAGTARPSSCSGS
jgi:hypothetical protein